MGLRRLAFDEGGRPALDGRNVCMSDEGKMRTK